MTSPAALPSEPSPTPASVPKQAALWEDFIDVITSPSQVFARRRQGRFGAAMLVLAAVTLLLTLAMRPVMQPMLDAQMDRAVETAQRQQHLSDEQVTKMRETLQKFGSVGVIAGPPLVAVLSMFAVGLLLWLAGKSVGSEATATQSIMVATYAYVPRVLGLVAGAGIGLLSDPARLTTPYHLTASPAQLVDGGPESLLATMLSRLDVFMLWETALLGVGLAIVGRITRGRAAGAAVAVWVLAAAWALIAALRARAAMG